MSFFSNQADPLPDYTQTTKCTEAGGTCNTQYVKSLQDGREFFCCTACGHIVKQKFADPSACAHPEHRESTVKSDGPNKGKRYRACRLCDKDFSWLNDAGEPVDKDGRAKKRRIAPTAVPAMKSEDVKRLENKIDSNQVQILALQQAVARLTQ